MATEVNDHWIWNRIGNVSTTTKMVAGLLTLAVLIVTPLVAPSGYATQYLFTIFFFTTLALGWNILSGFTGYINFGYAGFVGLGAYAAVLPMTYFGVPWYGGLVIAGVATTIVGVLISYPLLRLSGAYFAIAMLALATAAGLAFSTQYLSPVTEGSTGISFFPEVSGLMLYYTITGLMIGAWLLTTWIATSPFGKRLMAIREDEMLAASLGVNTFHDKMIAMALHSGIAGLCGAMLAFNLSYIDPSTVFDIQYTEYPIIMVLFGGLGTAVGPVLGGVTIGILREFFWGQFPTFHLAIMGGLIVLLVLFLPEGVVEKAKQSEYIPRTRWL